MKFPLTRLQHYKSTLTNHGLLTTDIIQTKEDLRIFMEHHVYAVWDFMSLAKSLQHAICPSGNLWLPTKLQRRCGRFINEVILAEESDIDPTGDSSISHFDLYLMAMAELGADTEKISNFAKLVEHEGISAIQSADIPEPAREFMQSTFNFIGTGKAHVVASVFTFGREDIIPDMFTRMCNQLDYSNLSYPRLRYYLDRHIEIDGNDHGPAAVAIVEELCEDDPVKIIEAEQAGITAIEARIKFWNDIKRTLSTFEY
jgi:hypothetical protein